MSGALTSIDLPDLQLLNRGKVRDVYATSDPTALLFVASDRISAYDVILNNGIPDKGKILTKMSLFWFEKLKDITPNHIITADVDQMPPDVKAYAEVLRGRAMLVRKAKIIPLEAIVRGYITGSAWSEYKKSGTMHGIKMPEGLVESQKLPEPVFTPSTKAEQGAHDENLHPDVGYSHPRSPPKTYLPPLPHVRLVEPLGDQTNAIWAAAGLIGKELCEHVSSVALELYSTAAAYAESQGVILADTKFEFGLVPCSSSLSSTTSDRTIPRFTLEDGRSAEVILADEVLTPDSSRFWPQEKYECGGPQPSFDKQYVRDWLTANGFKKGLEAGLEGSGGWTIAEEVVLGTQERYEEAWKRLSGEVSGEVSGAGR